MQLSVSAWNIQKVNIVSKIVVMLECSTLKLTVSRWWSRATPSFSIIWWRWFTITWSSFVIVTILIISIRGPVIEVATCRTTLINARRWCMRPLGYRIVNANYTLIDLHTRTFIFGNFCVFRAKEVNETKSTWSTSLKTKHDINFQLNYRLISVGSLNALNA